jgi:hypothetical protein
MQDDARFAEMFVRGQWITKTQAPNRIAYVSWLLAAGCALPWLPC